MALGTKAGRLESCKHCSALRLLVSDVSTHGTHWGGRHRRCAQPDDPRQDLPEHPSRHGDLRHLEGDIAAVADHLGANLDQLLPERRQRPARHRAWQGQGAHEVGEVVGQRVKLKPDLVVAELLAGEARPLDRVLALMKRGDKINAPTIA